MRLVTFIRELKKIEYGAFDAIHFHETVDIWRFHHLLGEFKGKIVLTSHSPKPYHLELLEDVFHSDKSKIWSSTYKKLEAIDKIAFQKTDMIVAPCKEALEAYQQHWPSFHQLTKSKPFQFIPTGIEKTHTLKSLTEVRNDLGIPEDAFVVCFNGRHNKVKGYDLLEEAAVDLFEAYRDIYFIVTGKKGDSDLIKNKRWLQTGWTTEPENFMNASDLVVVPNRETYFDLNVLTALSMGKPVVLSDTGGNKYFKQFSSPGILFFDVQKTKALKQIIQYAYENRKNLRATSGQNSEIYRLRFTVDLFTSELQQFYLSI
ncbi:MAG TPA: glycosyltransferase family 4 protein, partial [Flavisolibacter sp.]|jgi:glycosyltransferase involved in cell wall biosynthesis|nr:glycosyltransferase family 4 protein [Flavisolibacter sp.]